MPTAQTPKDRTTVAVRKVMQEMEINVMVTNKTFTLYRVLFVFDILTNFPVNRFYFLSRKGQVNSVLLVFLSA